MILSIRFGILCEGSLARWMASMLIMNTAVMEWSVYMLDDGDDTVTMVTKQKADEVMGKRNFPGSLRRPRIYWGWVVVVSSSIMFVIAYGFMYSFGIIMVELMNEFGSSATKTGYIGTMAYGLSSVSCLITAPINVRLGYRLGAMFGLISCIISCVVTSFASDLSLMFFSHGVLYGFGASMMMCGGINVPISYFPGKHISLATGLSTGGANLGVLIMNPFVYTLANRFGWRNMFRIISALLFVIGAPAILTFAPPSLETVEEIGAESENLKEKSPVFRKNSGHFVQGEDGEKFGEKTPAKGCRGGLNEITSFYSSTRQRGNAENERTMIKSDGDSIGEFNALNRCHSKDDLLSADRTETDVIWHHNSLGKLTVSSSYNCSKPSYKALHLNGVINASHLKSSFDGGSDEKESRQPKDTKPSTTNDAGVRRKAYWEKMIRLLRMPDVWLLELGLMTASIGLSFLLFSTANVIVTAGFSKKTASLVMAVMGFSEFIGKIVIGVVSDRLPIPKIFIIIAANCVGAVLILTLSFVATKSYLFTQATVQGFFVMATLDSLPHSVGYQLFFADFGVQIWAINMIFMGTGGIFGAVFGESVDKTGSYDAAFYATMGIFILSTIFLGLAVVQQRVFARERFFVFTNVGKNYAKIQENMTSPEHCQKLTISGCTEILPHSSPSLIITERVSSV